MLITEEILKEAQEFSEEMTKTLFDVMDETHPCDFENEEEYAETIVDYTLGRLGYDMLDDERADEYEELYEIAMRGFGPTLFIFYNQICGDNEIENPLD
jgi:uncharacterized protein YfbU (UPF0304 family)